MRISDRDLETILDRARRGHPFEVCGVLLGRAAEGITVEEAVPVENHEQVAPRVRYEIAPEDLLRLQRESRAAGRDIVGFYHTHPDHPARPSETDRRIAAEGLSDGLVHMVISVDVEGNTTPSAWVFRDALQGFEEEALDVLRAAAPSVGRAGR